MRGLTRTDSQNTHRNGSAYERHDTNSVPKYTHRMGFHGSCGGNSQRLATTPGHARQKGESSPPLVQAALTWYRSTYAQPPFSNVVVKALAIARRPALHGPPIRNLVQNIGMYFAPIKGRPCRASECCVRTERRGEVGIGFAPDYCCKCNVGLAL